MLPVLGRIDAAGRRVNVATGRRDPSERIGSELAEASTHQEKRRDRKRRKTEAQKPEESQAEETESQPEVELLLLLLGSPLTGTTAAHVQDRPRIHQPIGIATQTPWTPASSSASATSSRVSRSPTSHPSTW